MQALILAGGFGTRLQSVLTDVPKPMAPIEDKPFLAYLLQDLKKQGITKVILSIHYQAEKIRAYFQSHDMGMDIHYVEEEKPLGTGGAILHALQEMKDIHQPLFVLNGDTFLKLDYQAMYQQHQKEDAAITLALCHVLDCSRYGKVITDDKRIIKFQEKGETGPGYINAGVYLLHPRIFSAYLEPQQFSFEHFLEVHLSLLSPHYFKAHDYFIDIGIPADYARAINELPAFGN